MAKKLKLSAAAVLLLIVVPLCMYTCALLVGVQLGRALERAGPPDSFVGGFKFSLRGAFEYVTKEIWDINVLGRRRGGSSRPIRSWVPVEVAPRRAGAVERALSNESYAALLLELVSERKRTANLTSSSSKRHYNHTSPRGVISVGPWGGSSGGQPFYMDGTSAPRLRSIVIYHSGAIHSLACEYTLAGDYDRDDGPLTMARRRRVAGPWGRSHSFGSRAVRAQIELRPGEHITAMEGTTGHFANVPGVVITSLTFRTSAGRTYGPYGSAAAAGSSHHFFSVPAADGGCIAGFWGRSGWLLDAIGVYVKPSCSCSSSSSSSHRAAKYYASRRTTREEPIVEN